MDLHELFAENLKRFRLLRGLTQTQLADELGVTLQTIFSYEKCARWPRPEVIAELAKALSVEPWQLLATEGRGFSVPADVVEHLAAAARGLGLKVSLPK